MPIEPLEEQIMEENTAFSLTGTYLQFNTDNPVHDVKHSALRQGAVENKVPERSFMEEKH